jgi:uncharacterized Zn finger protein (UPF0148 family)
MSFLSICPTHKTQKRTQTLPHRAAEATANLRMQRLSPKNTIQLEAKIKKQIANHEY